MSAVAAVLNNDPSAEHTSSCLICGGAEIESYFEGTNAQLTSSALGSSRKKFDPGQIRRCGGCGFAFRQERPSQEDLTSLYRELDSAVYESESRGRLKTARRHLKIVERYLTGERLLDVGCASGTFLNCAADAGWAVIGLEPAVVLFEKAQRTLRGRGEVYCASLQEADLEPGSFDAITLWDVLEHVTDPVSTLQCCANLLRPGGYLFANVPDIESLQARCLGARWPLLLPEHLNYFTRASLRRCGESVNLEHVNFQRRPASFSVEYVLYRLMQHGIPGASSFHRVLKGTWLGGTCMPAMLGESCAIWRCSQTALGGVRSRGTR